MVQVNCSICNEIFFITVRSFVAPYVCFACRDAKAQAEKNAASFSYPTGEKFFPVEAAPQAAAVRGLPDPTESGVTAYPLSEETATIGNTVELVRDLQQQLADAQSFIEHQQEVVCDFIREFTTVAQSAIEDMRILEISNDSLVSQNEKLGEENRILTRVIRHLVS